jgi:hypothetical protein
MRAGEGPQLLITGADSGAACRPVPAGWDASRPEVTERAAAVVEDLRRYLGGLSAQFTETLPALWHGRVRFCSDAVETEVLRGLAVLVIRPEVEDPYDPSALDGGAEVLLVPLASSALVTQLEAIHPRSPAEAARRDAALRLVRARLAARDR